VVDFVTLPALIIVALLLLSSAIRVVREYERGVVFRLGRLIGAKGPGIIFLIPIVDRMVKVDLRTITLDVPSQEIITKDNVTVRVNAVVYFRIIDPERAIVEVENYLAATSMIAQTTLRSIIGQAELDELLAEREKLNERLQSVIDQQTDPWGVKVTAVEIKDVEIPQTMQRAMAAQAEAERERRAKIISAQGEFQAAQKLAEAAQIMAREPGAMQLRFLQTVREATSEKASVFILPVPIELLEPFLKYRDKQRKRQEEEESK
jgi:regulator of protease activity HflC (stomatin/prohibitin superfamily)